MAGDGERKWQKRSEGKRVEIEVRWLDDALSSGSLNSSSAVGRDCSSLDDVISLH